MSEHSMEAQAKMIVYYKIVDVWPQDQTITVRYYTSNITEEELRSSAENRSDDTPVRCRTDTNISIPYPRPTDSEFENLVKQCCPTKFLQTQEMIKNKKINTEITKYENMIGIMNYFNTEKKNQVDPVIENIINTL